jgi:hypothetical protein
MASLKDTTLETTHVDPSDHYSTVQFKLFGHALREWRVYRWIVGGAGWAEITSHRRIQRHDGPGNLAHGAYVTPRRKRESVSAERMLESETTRLANRRRTSQWGGTADAPVLYTANPTRIG